MLGQAAGNDQFLALPARPTRVRTDSSRVLDEAQVFTTTTAASFSSVLTP